MRDRAEQEDDEIRTGKARVEGFQGISCEGYLEAVAGVEGVDRFARARLRP